MHSQTATIEKVVQETHNTRTLRLRLERSMDFKAGQFIMTSVAVDGKLENRAFSISSSPTHKDWVEITVKVYPPGKVSPRLYDMKAGEKLKIKGPYGKFIFQDANDIVLIGGGSGIAPLMAMIRYCKDRGLRPNITLIYGFRTQQDIIFEQELREAQWLRCIFTVEKPESDWTGPVGRVSVELIKKSVDNLSTAVFYICGPPAMSEVVERGLKEFGVPKEHIKTDKWF